MNDTFGDCLVWMNRAKNNAKTKELGACILSCFARKLSRSLQLTWIIVRRHIRLIPYKAFGLATAVTDCFYLRRNGQIDRMRRDFENIYK